MSKDMVFPREHDGCQPRLQGLVEPNDGNTSIPKPPGEVTRLRRGGYSLISTLGWQEEKYDEVQASALLQREFDSPLTLHPLEIYPNIGSSVFGDWSNLREAKSQRIGSPV
jgi:hypothetical protein